MWLPFGRFGDEIDGSADRIGILLGGEGLAHLDGGENIGRNVVEFRNAVTAPRSGNMRTVDRDVGEPGFGAADLHELPLALVSFLGDPRNSPSRLARL